MTLRFGSKLPKHRYRAIRKSGMAEQRLADLLFEDAVKTG